MRSKRSKGSTRSTTLYRFLSILLWKYVRRTVRRDARAARAKVGEHRVAVAGALVAATAAIAAAAALAHRANGSSPDV
jgi:hypothetical protein